MTIVKGHFVVPLLPETTSSYYIPLTRWTSKVGRNLNSQVSKDWEIRIRVRRKSVHGVCPLVRICIYIRYTKLGMNHPWYDKYIPGHNRFYVKLENIISKGEIHELK